MTGPILWNRIGLETAHEQRAASRIVEMLVGLGADQRIHVAFGFRIAGAEIDCAVFTPGGVLIAELKEWPYRVWGAMNGRWQRVARDGSLIEMPGEQNPYQQVLRQRSKLTTVLREHGRRLGASQLSDHRLSDRIGAGVLQCPRMDAETGSIDERWWFLDGLDQFHVRVERLLRLPPFFEPKNFATYLASIGCPRDPQDLPGASAPVKLAAQPAPATIPGPTPRRRGTGVTPHRDPVLTSLADRQRTAIQQLPADHHLLVVAGPGSGKTEFLAGRALHLLRNRSSSREIALVTFTTTARDNLEERVARLAGGSATQLVTGLWIGTVHQFAREMLLRRGDGWQRCRVMPQNIERRAIARILGNTAAPAGATEQHVDEFLRDINAWNGDGVFPVHAGAAKTWEQEMRKRDTASFAGMLWCAVSDVEKADVERIPQAVLVDEFQDLTGLQLRFLIALARRGAVVTAVGDPEQAIFGYAGASRETLKAFDKSFPGTRRDRLTYNGRSPDNLVAMSQRLRRDGATQEALCIGNGVATIQSFPSPTAEAHHIAAQILRLASPDRADSRYSFRQIAVLLRETRAPELVRALKEKEVPFREEFAPRALPLSLRQFASVAEAAMATDTTAALDAVGDGPRQIAIALSRTARQSPAITEVLTLFEKACDAAKDPRVAKALTAMQTLARDGRSGGSNLGEVVARSYAEAIVPFSSFFHRANPGLATYERESLMRLTQQVTSLDDLVHRLLGGTPIVSDPETDEVTLATIHRAKGREWPVVFVTTVTEGVIPHRLASDMDEERRLLYVAMTRASAEQYISWVEHTGDRGAGRSRFLTELDPERT